MPNKMDEEYYNKKKELACESLRNAIKDTESALEQINKWRYPVRILLDVNELHETLKHAEVQIRSARRDFEKARWASADTRIEFDEWLKKGPGLDLN